MPGLIVGIAVTLGARRSSAAQRLFTIEAMKMETAVYAETAGKVSELVIEPGHRVDTHDLIIVLTPEE